MRSILITLLIFYFLGFNSCTVQADKGDVKEEKEIIVGAERIEDYLNLIKNKKIGVVSNQTSLVKTAHLVDTLLVLGINVEKVYAPEHGFRGDADAGESVDNMIDKKTGLPIISIYGNNYKPTKENLAGIDLMIFDIQDVGVRFFTYISSLHYVMEACAENNIPLIVLDRPNPNGFYIDGPILEKEYKSFVGMHPVPIVYGMTIGEYAKMINGQGWLNDSIQCDLTVIPCENYTHSSFYELPVKPSPNLPTMKSIYLYPSTAFFEGTVVNEGRGTETPFEVFGHPNFEGGDYSYTPISIPGMSKNPKLLGQICYGVDLRSMSIDSLREMAKIQLEWLELAYNYTKVDEFFIPFFEKISGTAELRKQIENGVSTQEIRNSWKEGLVAFKAVRERYLIYP